MVVNNVYFHGVAIFPKEDQPPLLIHSDTPESRQITRELFQMIAGRYPHVVDGGGHGGSPFDRPEARSYDGRPVCRAGDMAAHPMRAKSAYSNGEDPCSGSIWWLRHHVAACGVQPRVCLSAPLPNFAEATKGKTLRDITPLVVRLILIHNVDCN